MMQWTNEKACNQEVMGSNPGIGYQMECKQSQLLHKKNIGRQIGYLKEVFKKAERTNLKLKYFASNCSKVIS